MDKHYPGRTTFLIVASFLPGKCGRGLYGESSFMGWSRRAFATGRGWAFVHTIEDAQQGVDELLGGLGGVIGSHGGHQAVFGSTGLELGIWDGH